MTLKEFKDLLETTGYTVGYDHFPTSDTPQMPFITYIESGSNNFGCDGKVYHQIKRLQVHLFTKKKDPVAEAKIENALKDIFWEKATEFNDNEICYRTVYEVEI